MSSCVNSAEADGERKRTSSRRKNTLTNTTDNNLEGVTTFGNLKRPPVAINAT
jgi:hypothetical protein